MSEPSDDEVDAFHDERGDVAAVLRGIECTHPKMAECHPGCGHWNCPDCGVSFDDAAEK